MLKLPYEKLNKVEIDGRRYYLAPSNNAYESATTWLGRIGDKSFLDDWRKRVGEKEADRQSRGSAHRGSKVHEMIETYFLENRRTDHLKEYYEAYSDIVRGMMPWLKKISEVWAIEKNLYSDTLKLAGTVDCVGIYNGVPSIIDFKTSTKYKRKSWIKNYFFQATLYSLMIEELTGIKIQQLVIIIGINEDNSQVFTAQRKDFFKELKEELIKNPPHHSRGLPTS